MKLSCDFMDRSPSRQVTILQSLMAIATVVEDESYNNFSLSRDFARVHDQKVVILWVGAPHGKLPHCRVWWP